MEMENRYSESKVNVASGTRLIVCSKQLVDSLAGFAYSFVVTFLILCVLNLNAWFGKVRKPRLVLD